MTTGLHAPARLMAALITAAMPFASTTADARGVPAAGGTQVKVAGGLLRGVAADGVIAFKGIPFAAAPVGALRWRAPQPAARWSGIRDASSYGSDCMQVPFPSDAAPLGTPPAEDCLYANVWKPAAARNKLPVMVWIYGGGFVNGGASPPTYSGAELAKQGILVFSFNYRVGRFGTFAHPQLTKADPDRGLLANYGYMDQLAALRWVQQNIAAFGGDPANVTIIGESAGGMSVHALLTSPLAKGLFARAVIQSGGPAPLGDTSLASAEKIGVAFAQSKGIAADDPAALAKLRALSADAVTDGLNMTALFRPAAGPRTFGGPIVDGRIAVDAVTAYQAGQFAKVPVMVGATSDDIGGRTGGMVNGARQIAGILAGQGVPTYYYRFSYVAGSARTPATKGASHATEIPFFFDTAQVKYGGATTATDRAAARLASGYLVNFVKSGDPNGAGLPAWGDHRGPAKPMLDLTAEGTATVGKDPWAE
jgi:para-nitrobenzyl esterase